MGLNVQPNLRIQGQGVGRYIGIGAVTSMPIFVCDPNFKIEYIYNAAVGNVYRYIACAKNWTHNTTSSS